MLKHDILRHPTTLLSAAQREQYFEEGAVLVEGAVPESWLKTPARRLGRDYRAWAAPSPNPTGLLSWRRGIPPIPRG